MKTFKQIVKEFWFPLAVTVLWAGLNGILPPADQSPFMKIVNVAAPTFFFASWATAQFFRVRKQEHVSGSLSSIGERILEVTERLETQAGKLETIANARLVQVFDECIDLVRDAKEELADRSRRIKSAPNIDAAAFNLHRGNPLYQTRRSADMLIGYAAYAVSADQPDLLAERFTRSSYHLEELAGHVSTFLGRLDRQGIDWRTEHSLALVNSIATAVERFEEKYLVLSRYESDPYKGDQKLRAVLQRHVARLRKLATA